SRRRHTRSKRDWSSDVCSSDLALAAELATGVQHGENDLEGGAAILATRDRLDRDAPAVVEHARRAVRVQRDDDLVAVARHGFVDRVVDDLIDEVMQASRTGGPDVHAGTLPARLAALVDLEAAGAVAGLLLQRS